MLGLVFLSIAMTLRSFFVSSFMRLMPLALVRLYMLLTGLPYFACRWFVYLDKGLFLMLFFMIFLEPP